MKTIPDHDRNEALGEALMEIMVRLREYPSGGRGRSDEERLFSGADSFVQDLAMHLRTADGTLFPALRELGPGVSGDLDSLEGEHRVLLLRARDLAARIRTGEREEAYRLTRFVLAALLEHTRREEEGVGRFVRSLDVPETRSLLRAVVEGHPSDEAFGGCSKAQRLERT